MSAQFIVGYTKDDKIRDLELELAQAKKIIDMLIKQDQVKGYPTASEWMKLVSCAREAAKKVQDMLEGGK